MSEEARPIPGVIFTVTLEQLRAADINSSLDEIKSIDCYDLRQHFDRLCDEGSEHEAAFQLLQSLTTYHIEPDSAAEPFKPMMIMEGRRSLVPADLLPEQIDVLAEFAPEVKNVGLKARLADVSWTIQRQRQALADLAIHSYCDGIEALLANDAAVAFKNDSAWCLRAKDMAVRATRISRTTRWQLSSADRVKALISKLVLQAAKDNRGDDFCRLAEVDLDHQLSDQMTVAAEAERIASLDTYVGNPESRKWLLDTAVRAYHIAKDNEGQHRCIGLIAACHEQKAEMTESAMLKSACLQEAIETLRRAPNTQDQRRLIEDRLRIIQNSISDEMVVFSQKIDITDIVENTIATVRGLSWPRALREFLFCDDIPSESECRNEARTHAHEHPLQSLFPIRVHDSQGRVTFQTTGLDDENQIQWLMSVDRKRERELAVAGIINPIRRTLADEHPIFVDAIEQMFRVSILVSPGHSRVFAKGLAAFLQGENIEAASILVPQLENTLRHAISLDGGNCTITDERGLQSEATLSLLLNRRREWRRVLEKMFPDGYVHKIESLFIFPGGKSVRHEVAHGKMSAANFWDDDVTYACWFILHMIALPMLPKWDEAEEAYLRATGEMRREHFDPDSR